MKKKMTVNDMLKFCKDSKTHLAIQSYIDRHYSAGAGCIISSFFFEPSAGEIGKMHGCACFTMPAVDYNKMFVKFDSFDMKTINFYKHVDFLKTEKRSELFADGDEISIVDVEKNKTIDEASFVLFTSKEAEAQIRYHNENDDFNLTKEEMDKISETTDELLNEIEEEKAKLTSQ